MKLTKKQGTIMTLVCIGNKDAAGNLESWLDIDQVMERCGYACSKQAMQFSIRYLLQKGLVEKSYECRRGSRRMVLAPSAIAFEAVNGTHLGDPE